MYSNIRKRNNKTSLFNWSIEPANEYYDGDFDNDKDLGVDIESAIE